MNALKHSLETNRKHIAAAYVDYCCKRNGGKPVLNMVVKRKVVALDNLTAEAVSRCLVNSIESQCFRQFGQHKGIPMLVETYTGMLNKDNSRLTQEGVDFMNEVMKEVVTSTMGGVGNKYGLEIYHA